MRPVMWWHSMDWSWLTDGWQTGLAVVAVVLLAVGVVVTLIERDV